jgi:hypothetical protein
VIAVAEEAVATAAVIVAVAAVAVVGKTLLRLQMHR